jgi:hypothetical protein
MIVLGDQRGFGFFELELFRRFHRHLRRRHNALSRAQQAM